MLALWKKNSWTCFPNREKSEGGQIPIGDWERDAGASGSGGGAAGSRGALRREKDRAVRRRRRHQGHRWGRPRTIGGVAGREDHRRRAAQGQEHVARARLPAASYFSVRSVSVLMSPDCFRLVSLPYVARWCVSCFWGFYCVVLKVSNTEAFLVIWEYLFFPLFISGYCVQAILGLFPCCIHTTLRSSMCRLPIFIFLKCSANV